VTESSIRHLLELAGVSPSNKKAAAWLSDAVEGARSNSRAANQRPLAADHNNLLADIEKSAQELTGRLERLRRHHFTRLRFWRSDVFGPVYGDRVEVQQVLLTLEKVVSAARGAKDARQGRRGEIGKQHVVGLAFAFFVRFSPHRPSGTPTGAFGAFARAFYSAAVGVAPESHGSLDRQIRQAVTRQSGQHVQRKAAQKPRVSS
jgi:hypothetical protein